MGGGTTATVLPGKKIAIGTSKITSVTSRTDQEGTDLMQQSVRYFNCMNEQHQQDRMTKKLRGFTTTAALVRERLAGAEEVAHDGLPLDQLEVLSRRGHLVGRCFPAAGRSLAKPLLDSPLGVIPKCNNNVAGIIAFI